MRIPTKFLKQNRALVPIVGISNKKIARKLQRYITFVFSFSRQLFFPDNR